MLKLFTKKTLTSIINKSFSRIDYNFVNNFSEET